MLYPPNTKICGEYRKQFAVMSVAILMEMDSSRRRVRVRDTIIACALSQYGSLSNLSAAVDTAGCVSEWGDANPIALFVCLRLMNFLCPACAAALSAVCIIYGELCMQEAPVISYLLLACTYFKPLHSD
jgi:hypothetical protein